MNTIYCSNCGAQTVNKIPQGDNRLRATCESCGTINYVNPKLVVGCIVEQNDQLLLCKRSINPRQGKWTLPAGYLENNNIPCARMSGKTEQLLVAEPIRRQGHDYGFVGQIKKVNADIISKALKAGRVPVVSPISADEAGNSYNVNADSAAASLAVGAGCTDLAYFTDVPGVKSGNDILSSLTVDEARKLISQGIIKDGMVAKMESAFEALKGHVKRVHITCWQGKETLQNIINQNSQSGTTIHIQVK